MIDNLKAAVLKAALEDTVLSVPYVRMAQEYGFLIHPCRPGTPQHKGKVESGIHYVERNFWDGDDFLDLDDANTKARRWVREIAGVRDHGTTHEAPLVRFEQDERAALLPLPTEPFDLVEVRRAKVHRDGYVTVRGSDYLAPHGSIGHTLEVHLYERTIQIYDGVTLLVTYDRATKRGERVHRLDLLPKGARLYLERTPERCREEAQRIGPACLAVVEALLSERPLDQLPAAGRLIGLEAGYGASRLEAACARSLAYGDPKPRRVKTILIAGLDAEPLPESLWMTESPSKGPAASPPDPSLDGRGAGGLAGSVSTYVHARPIQAFFPTDLFHEGNLSPSMNPFEEKAEAPR